jgi:hypothetical protein
MPSRRARRASFLPRPSRSLACTLYSFFSAMSSPYKLSATGTLPIFDCQLPISSSLIPTSLKLAIGNLQSAMLPSLMVFV